MSDDERYDLAGRPLFCDVCDKVMTWQERMQELRRDGTIRYGHRLCLEGSDPALNDGSEGA